MSDDPDPNKKSYTQRMIAALAAINDLVADGQSGPLLALAPEVVVERVKAFAKKSRAVQAGVEAYAEASKEKAE